MRKQTQYAYNIYAELTVLCLLHLPSIGEILKTILTTGLTSVSFTF